MHDVIAWNEHVLVEVFKKVKFTPKTIWNQRAKKHESASSDGHEQFET